MTAEKQRTAQEVFDVIIECSRLLKNPAEQDARVEELKNLLLEIREAPAYPAEAHKLATALEFLPRNLSFLGLNAVAPHARLAIANLRGRKAKT